MLNVHSRTRLLAVLVWVVLLTLMRCQVPSSLSCLKKGVFILSSVPRDTPILPQTPSYNRYEERYELPDFNDICMLI
jgi:hypothetical protein